MNDTTREVIARAVCWIAICNEGHDGAAADIERRVTSCWEGYLEDADAVLNALIGAGYQVVKEHS